MVMNSEQALQFLEAFSKGTHTGAAQQAFLRWLAQAGEEEVEKIMLDYEALIRNMSSDEAPDPALVALIEARLDQQEAPAPLRKISRQRYTWIAAAVFLLLLTAGGYLFFRSNNIPSGKKPVMTASRYRNDIAPGADKAVLTLADGSAITLDSSQSGKIAQQGSVNIHSQQGQLIYHTNSDAPVTALNTVSTPAGGQYQVVLPDGTRAWLNASSSITFPVAFNNKERTVLLKGEAYFEVARDTSRTFRISVNDTKIEVLGTRFNVMAYNDEHVMKVTLVEGSVQLAAATGRYMLKPGQQASLQPNNTVALASVNTDEAIAWKNGLFRFRNADIQTIMRQVARWYNIEVSYEGALPYKTFTGVVSRNEKISALLQFLELTGAVHFAVEGNKVTVMP